tara:strand:+ start:9463 stop:9792 length:330 start_codon:yes stop_codon:yes gene_type:complete
MSTENHPNFHAVNFVTQVMLYALGEAPLEGEKEEVEYIESAYLDSIARREIDPRTAPNIRPLIKGFRGKVRYGELKDRFDTGVDRQPVKDRVVDFSLQVETVVDGWRGL